MRPLVPRGTPPSTDGQSSSAQLAELKVAKCAKIFQEKISGARSDRGAVRAEITAITRDEMELSEDEQPANSDASKIQVMKPVFAPHGTVTAANASSISDGAAAVVLLSAAAAERRVVTPLARVVAQASFAQEPAKYVTAPVGAILRVTEKAGWRLTDVDLFEINEAFAVVARESGKGVG
jgi:acetyl-CoA acetyltransferase